MRMKLMVVAVGMALAGVAAAEPPNCTPGTEGSLNKKCQKPVHQPQTINSNASSSNSSSSNYIGPVQNTNLNSTAITMQPTTVLEQAAAPSEVTIKNTPDVFASIPNPTAHCVVTGGGGVSVAGFGVTASGSTIDAGCDAREDARLLVNMGLTAEAVTRLCMKPGMMEALGARCKPAAAKAEADAVARVVP